jgi:hypothetical protein
MHPMFVELFLKADADDLLADQDKKRRAAARRAKRSQARLVTRVAAPDPGRRTPR